MMFLAFKLLLIFAVISVHVTNCQRRTRKNAGEIPPAAFPQNGCRILLNELNLFAPHDEQYIELSVYCDSQPKKQRAITMKNFKLIFISHDAKLLGVCNLDGSVLHAYSRYWFYTVSNNNADYTNFNIEKCELSIDINPLRTTPKMFPGGSNHPFGVALLYSAHENILDDIKLDQTEIEGVYLTTDISSKLETKIVKYLQDFYVVATSSPYNMCEYFKTYYIGYNEDSLHVLRDFQGNVYSTDYGLSRCGNTLFIDRITQPLMPALFVHAEKTPGDKNKCDNGFGFSVETTQPLRKRPRADFEYQHPRFRCYSMFEDSANDIDLIAYPQTYQSGLDAAQQTMGMQKNENLVVPESFNIIEPSSSVPSAETLALESTDTCRSEFAADDLNDGSVNLENIIDEGEDMEINVPAIEEGVTPEETVEVAENQSIEDADEDITVDGRTVPRSNFKASPLTEEEATTFLESVPRHITPDCSGFSQEKRTEITDLPGSPIDIAEVLNPNKCSWFQYIPELQKFRCKFCHFLLNQRIIFDSPGSPHITHIMWKGAGKITGKDRKVTNRKFLNDHVNNPLHKIAVNFFELYDSGLRSEDLVEAFDAKDGLWRNYLKATEQLILSAYQATKMNIPFYSFNKLTELLKHFKTEVGHVHVGDEGMKKLVMAISNTLHQDLVNHLLTEKKPLSLTLDCSTDIGGYPILALMFQTFAEDETIKVFIYRLIEAKSGETGVELFNLFKAALAEDGLEQHVKDNLFGLSTDGAPNVLKVFRNQLNSYVKNEIVATHCCCHRVELVNRRVFEQYDYLRFIDSKVNQLFKFFNNKSAKRKRVLKTMAEFTRPGAPTKQKRWELHRIIKIRFVNSKLRALSAIFDHWKDIGSALQEITEDNSFKWEHRQIAEDLMNILKDGTFMSTLAFLADVDTELSAMSLQFQKKGVTLIPKKEMRNTLYERISELKLSNGAHLTKLLGNAEFDLDDTHGFLDPVTLQDFEEKEIRLWGVSLEESSAIYDEYRLHLNKDAYIESLLDQIENYFPADTTDNFTIFDQNNFPTRENEYVTYGVEEISDLNTKLLWNQKWGISDVAVRTEWKKLTLMLFKNPQFTNLISEKPEDFWTYFLSDSSFNFPPAIKKIISNVITAPCTSVEPERIFSLYSAAKTKRRYSLLPQTVEAIVRIKYTATSSLNDVDTQGIAQKFLTAYSRSDDASRRETWQKKSRTPPSEAADDSDAESNCDV